MKKIDNIEKNDKMMKEKSTSLSKLKNKHFLKSKDNVREKSIEYNFHQPITTASKYIYIHFYFFFFFSYFKYIYKIN
jgi:hypothetical protein